MMAAPTRSDLEDFLFAEADLLDAWRLDEWFALFAEGGTYHVPSSGGSLDDDSATRLFYIADDYDRLRERVTRLNHNDAHAESPRSTVQRSITNVRIIETDKDEVVVECNFGIYRAKHRKWDLYVGKSRYRIDCSQQPYRIISKRSHLAMDVLYPGKISIIV